MKLRPINETRRPDGTMTSETAYRLLKRRGGLAGAAVLRARGFRDLEKARAISILVRRAKSLEKASCAHCKPLHESVLRILASLQQQPASTIQAEDLAKLR